MSKLYIDNNHIIITPFEWGCDYRIEYIMNKIKDKDNDSISKDINLISKEAIKYSYEKLFNSKF